MLSHFHRLLCGERVTYREIMHVWTETNRVRDVYDVVAYRTALDELTCLNGVIAVCREASVGSLAETESEREAASLPATDSSSKSRCEAVRFLPMRGASGDRGATCSICGESALAEAVEVVGGKGMMMNPSRSWSPPKGAPSMAAMVSRCSQTVRSIESRARFSFSGGEPWPFNAREVIANNPKFRTVPSAFRAVLAVCTRAPAMRSLKGTLLVGGR